MCSQNLEMCSNKNTFVSSLQQIKQLKMMQSNNIISNMNRDDFEKSIETMKPRVKGHYPKIRNLLGCHLTTVRNYMNGGTPDNKMHEVHEAVKKIYNSL